MGELKNAIEDIAPFQLARLRGKRVELSSRDKKQLLAKVAEIEEILSQMEKKLKLKIFK